jgi:hypothetical protein
VERNKGDTRVKGVFFLRSRRKLERKDVYARGGESVDREREKAKRVKQGKREYVPVDTDFDRHVEVLFGVVV